MTLRTILLAAASILATACEDDPTTPRPTEARKPAMAIVSGDRQSAEVGTTLAAPLVVRVLDSLGAPAAGVIVRFSSTSATTRDSIATDAQGLASVRWTLGELAAAQEILARATVYPANLNGVANASFSATAIAGAPTRIVVSGGDGAVAAPGTKVDQVVVTAIDRFGNASPGAQVDWGVSTGGGTVNLADTRTDATGTAKATWIMGPSEGQNSLAVRIGTAARELTATASVAFPGTVVVAGETHSCALAPSGAAYCWGDNSGAQLGLGRIDDVLNTTPQRVSGSLSFVSLVAGAGHTCGLTATGDAYCWGNGRSGQLGVASVSLVATPTRVVGGGTYEMLAAGARHTCGLTTAHVIYCWGDNTVGQLSDALDRPVGPNGSRDTPVPILVTGASAFTSIAAGTMSTCAIAANGDTYCWGANASRELGGDFAGRCAVVGTLAFYDGTTPLPCSAAPVRLPLPSIVSLAVNKSGWCGVTLGSALVCWGNLFDVPLIVAPARVTAAWVVGPDVCGRESDASVACWGVWGRAGFPVVRPFGDQVRLANLASGIVHSCGLSTDGKSTVYCWGANSSGQLGDGTTNSRVSPVPVLSPRAN